MKFIIIAIAICFVVAGYRSGSADQADVATSESVPAVSTATTHSASKSTGAGAQTTDKAEKNVVTGGAYGIVSAILDCPNDALSIVSTGTASPACGS